MPPGCLGTTCDEKLRRPGASGADDASGRFRQDHCTATFTIDDPVLSNMVAQVHEDDLMRRWKGWVGIAMHVYALERAIKKFDCLGRPGYLRVDDGHSTDTMRS